MSEKPFLFAINGSPRPQGNTETLLDSFLSGAERAGADIEKINAANLKISPCLNCGGCDKTGQCVVQDAMQSLYPKLLAADLLVLASPLFFMGPTAQIKAVIDRTQALWTGKYLLGADYSKGKRPRWGFLIGVGATKGEKVFNPLQTIAKTWFRTLDAAESGDLLIAGVDEKGAIAQGEYLAMATEAGYDLVKKWQKKEAELNS